MSIMLDKLNNEVIMKYISISKEIKNPKFITAESILDRINSKWVIYKIIFIATGEFYLGVTNRLYRRIADHLDNEKIYLYFKFYEKNPEHKLKEITSEKNFWKNEYYQIEVLEQTFDIDTNGELLSKIAEEILIHKYNLAKGGKNYLNSSEGEFGNYKKFKRILEMKIKENLNNDQLLLDSYWSLIAIQMKRDTLKFHMNEQIGAAISKLLVEANLKDFHNENKFKGYVFSNPGMFNNNIYDKNRGYNFYIRSHNLNLLLKMLEITKHKTIEVDSFEIIGMTIPRQRIINKPLDCYSFYTLNPMVMTKLNEKNKYIYLRREDISEKIIKKAIIINLSNKILQFYKKKMSITDFIEDISIINNKDYHIHYKTRVYANRIRFTVSKDAPRELISIIDSCGVGQKNSILGTGFCSLEA